MISFKDVQAYYTIMKSGLFDSRYYLLQYCDVRRSDAAPLLHFVLIGWKEGRNPCEQFNTNYYLEQNPDVKAANSNPFIHYLLHGKAEGRRGSPNVLEANKLNSPKTEQAWARILFSQQLSLRKVLKGCLFLIKYGPKAFINKVRNQLHLNLILMTESAEAIDFQRRVKFPYEPLISIVVPALNTKEKFLRDMIESLFAQTYAKWELCIADGGSRKEFHIEDILSEYAATDSRIRYIMLGKNLGIAENTNAALQLATGDYIGFLDHDDILSPSALYEVVKSINEHREPDFLYSDEDKFFETGKQRFEPYLKSGFSIDMLRSFNYIGHFSVVKHTLITRIGELNSNFNGSQDYDFILRVAENTSSIVHIPKILYHWRMHEASVALNPQSKLYAYEAGKNAIQQHLNRVGLPGTVADGLFLGSYQIKYDISALKKISIIIPNKDHIDDLKRCIQSIVAKSSYGNYEIIVVENNSTEESTFNYYNILQQMSNIRIVKWLEVGFNFSSIINYGVKFATGDYILLLNNDTEVITPEWLELMVMYLQREDVGVVGAKLYYPDDTIQHAGVFIHSTGAAGHMAYKIPRDASGYFGRAKVVQNVSAVTGACLMVKKELFAAVDGFDEDFLKVAYNDVDFCMKIRALHKLIVYTPFAELYHYESKSRGSDLVGDNFKRWSAERDYFLKKWEQELEKGDPYYNKLLC